MIKNGKLLAYMDKIDIGTSETNWNCPYLVDLAHFDKPCSSLELS